MWCSLVGSVVAVFRALSSTGAITTDVRNVTERCFFDRRRGCSSGSRGSCASFAAEPVLDAGQAAHAEAEVVSSSAKSECL